MNKKVKTNELFESINKYIYPLFENAEYPWEVLPRIKEYVQTIIKNGMERYILYSENVLTGKDVKIYPGVYIEGPAVIGSGSEIRPGAFIRGSVICGEKCVIGNSSELKNCVLLDRVQVPHYNYVGDSVLGNCSHMGAGAVCSNLKADKSRVIVRGEENYETGLKKMGAILGDGADVGCGCVLNPGTVIGKNTSVYPLTSVRGVIGEDCIVKSMDNIIRRK